MRAALLAAALAPLAAQAGEISGRVIHPSRPAEAARIPVRLLGFAAPGGEITRETRTDAAGSFRFGELAPGGYFVLAEYAGIVFPGGRATFTAEDPNRSESMAFHVYDRGSDPSELRLASLRWILEREAGVYRVSQVVGVRNPTGFVIEAAADAPAALRIPLARGHGDVEAPFGRMPGGAAIEAGALELRGPFLPGEREYVIAYDVAAQGNALETEFALPPGAELVELLVRDFGVRADVTGLHPARSARQSDELYLRWVGFEPEGGSVVPVRLEPLAPREPPSRALQALLAAALSALVAAWVLRPIGSRAVALPSRDAQSDERDAVVAALRDLEHDYETGKLSAEDRERLRSDLRREALRAMRPAPVEPARAEPGPAAAPACSCGRAAQAGDRFCAACGKPL
jgi:cytochrome c-type biogenesis protein CcmI